MSATVDTLKAIADDKSLPIEVRRAAWRAFNRSLTPGEPDENRDELSYNGWTNYETWAVNLWLSNDEGLYNETLSLIGMIHDDEDNTYRAEVADEIKTFVDGLTPDLGASFAADLLGHALDQVDWFEIADSWIEDLADVSAEVDC